MNELPNTNPDVYQMLDEWPSCSLAVSFLPGVSTNLAIEQELMGSVKKTGGLTRGRAMIKLQRAKRLLSKPACAEIKRAIHSLSGK